MKKKPKVKSLPKVSTLENKLWPLCRQLIFKKFGRNCYTCPQTNLVGMNLQCGHAFPKGALGASMKYDLRILRPQCFQCNINYGGMQAIFWKNLERDIGKRKADKLYMECTSSKGKPINARSHYMLLLHEYGLLPLSPVGVLQC